MTGPHYPSALPLACAVECLMDTFLSFLLPMPVIVYGIRLRHAGLAASGESSSPIDTRDRYQQALQTPRGREGGPPLWECSCDARNGDCGARACGDNVNQAPGRDEARGRAARVSRDSSHGNGFHGHPASMGGG